MYVSVSQIQNRKCSLSRNVFVPLVSLHSKTNWIKSGKELTEPKSKRLVEFQLDSEHAVLKYLTEMDLY